MEGRAYMVTFKKVDPLFVIDVEDARNPKVLGYLKITGYSDYLHIYDKDHIIGVGKEASGGGEDFSYYQGLKISLFDVSDVENPKEITKFVAKDEFAQSSAEWEHKAFLFSKEKALLVIPAYSYDYKTNKQLYNGAMVFRITVDEIKLRGVIDHAYGGDYWYSPTVERSLYINELLYTKSPNLLRINELEDLDTVKKIELKPTASNVPIY